MANGSTRIALAQIQIKKQKQNAENENLMTLANKNNKVPKIPLKNPTPNNHSK